MLRSALTTAAPTRSLLLVAAVVVETRVEMHMTLLQENPVSVAIVAMEQAAAAMATATTAMEVGARAELDSLATVVRHTLLQERRAFEMVVLGRIVTGLAAALAMERQAASGVVARVRATVVAAVVVIPAAARAAAVAVRSIAAPISPTNPISVQAMVR